MASKKIEDGIRSYLEALGHSGKPVVDREAIKALKSQIRSEADPINKLKLLSQLEQEEAGHLPDFSGVEAVFVAEAKGWADTEGVTSRALQTLGVPDDVLKRAGFELLMTTDRPARSARQGAGTRAPAIPLDVVAAEARKLGSGWKVTDLAERLDREPMTVRNYVLRLIEHGVIADLGDDPKHNGRGRAPKIYGVA